MLQYGDEVKVLREFYSEWRNRNLHDLLQHFGTDLRAKIQEQEEKAMRLKESLELLKQYASEDVELRAQLKEDVNDEDHNVSALDFELDLV